MAEGDGGVVEQGGQLGGDLGTEEVQGRQGVGRGDDGDARGAELDAGGGLGRGSDISL